MKIEIRANGSVHISGYVNAVERDSRVLPAEMAGDAKGDFVEQVKAGAWQRAIEKNPDVLLCFNHGRSIGGLKDGTLKLTEDAIGLHADAEITDIEVVAEARAGHLTGWSFGFSGEKTEWEERADGVNRRIITDLELSEVSILTLEPAYIGTSVEMRGADVTRRVFRSTADAPITEDKTPVRDFEREIITIELEV